MYAAVQMVISCIVDQFTGESRPVVLPLDEKEIIRGLKDVIIGMKVGGNILNLTIVLMARVVFAAGKRRALIPPEVGYISENLKPIPDECEQCVIHSLVLEGAYYLTQKNRWFLRFNY